MCKGLFLNMKIMLFTDLENFKQSLWEIDSRRQPNFDKFHYFLVEDISKKLNWNKYNPRLIRAYLYTGEFTESLLSKIKSSADNAKTQEEKEKLNEEYNKQKRRKESQANLIKYIQYCNFLELKTIPLHFTKQAGVFQKGIDVQLAVDLVHHAYKDNFDVAIVCSGDIDLLESIKLIKNHGKKAILVSHPNVIAKNMIKECDYFYDLSKLKEIELNNLSNMTNKP